MAHHGSYPHDIVPPKSRYYDSGRFGRMFATLPPFAADTPEIREALLDIGRAGGVMDAKDKLSEGPIKLITDPELSQHNPDNPSLTAGFTFLGQFIDHDMTFDPTSSLERQVDPKHISNFRTPSLALDNVYGAGWRTCLRRAASSTNGTTSRSSRWNSRWPPTVFTPRDAPSRRAAACAGPPDPAHAKAPVQTGRLLPEGQQGAWLPIEAEQAAAADAEQEQ